VVAFAPVAPVPAVQRNVRDEVEVEVLDQERPVVVCRPPALHLDPTRSVSFGIEGDQVVTWLFRIRLRRLYSLDEQQTEHEELGAFGFERTIEPRSRRHRAQS